MDRPEPAGGVATPRLRSAQPHGTPVDRVEVSTVVNLPRETVYDRLFEYTGYSRHTPNLEDVAIRGSGSGTEFALSFAWWKLEYTARCRVTDVDPPERIDWEVLGGIESEGYWALEPEPAAAPPDCEAATRVRLRIEFDRANSRVGGLRLPPMVSPDWVLRRIKPVVRREARRLTGEVVADLEGEARPVELSVHATPDTI